MNPVTGENSSFGSLYTPMYSFYLLHLHNEELHQVLLGISREGWDGQRM
jgi:hypothetical protein